MKLRAIDDQNVHGSHLAEAVAVGLVLALTISAPVGIAVGVTVLMPVGKNDSALARAGRIACAVAVGVLVYVGGDILNHWDVFKSGFMAGWNSH